MVNVDLYVYSMCIGYAFTVLSAYDITKQNDQWGSCSSSWLVVSCFTRSSCHCMVNLS